MSLENSYASPAFGKDGSRLYVPSFLPSFRRKIKEGTKEDQARNIKEGRTIKEGRKIKEGKEGTKEGRKIKEGRKEGRKIKDGRKKGRKQGRKEGRKEDQGRKEGTKEGRKEDQGRKSLENSYASPAFGKDGSRLYVPSFLPYFLVLPSFLFLPFPSFNRSLLQAFFPSFVPSFVPPFFLPSFLP
jgi:hypothetical protein